jgi:ubiquinone/menaquinone biosynthesis C-methylase UbiE
VSTAARPGGTYDPHAAAGGLPGALDRLEAQAALGWREEARILGEVGLRDGARVLEVGCGSGALLERLHALLPGSALHGIDADPELLAHACDRLPAEVTLTAGDAAALPLPDSAADFAVARLLFQHVPDPLAVAREARRALAPGGTLAAIEVDGELWGLVSPHLPELGAIHAKAWSAQTHRGGDRYIGRRLYRILVAAGFEDVVVRPYAYHSDEHGLDAFRALIHPDALAPALADGTLTPLEFGRAVAGYERFRADPDAFVMLVGLVVAGRVPG